MRAWGVEFAVLAVCGVVVPLALAVFYGSLYSPAADDWSYDLSTFHLALHGVVNLNHWGTVNAIGQMALAAPFVWLFGPHIAVLNIWACLTGLVGLLSTDYLLRRAGAGRWAALAVAAALSLGPMYSAIAVSFMTDIPSYALMMTALAVAVSDGSRERMLTRRSAVALLLGVVAFTIREPTGIAFAAVAMGRVWRCPRRARMDWLAWSGAVVVVGVASLIFYVWRREIPTTGWEAPPMIDWWQLDQWYSQEWLLPLLGLMLLVPVMVSRPLEAVRAAWRGHRTAVTSLWLLIVVGPWLLRYATMLHDLVWHIAGTSDSVVPPLGNWYFGNTGDAGLVPPIVPEWGLAGLAVLSSLVWVPACACLVLAWFRWRSEIKDGRDGQPSYAAVLAALAGAGSVVLLALIIVAREQMWDRYLFPVAGTVAVVIAYASRSAELVPAEPRRRPVRLSLVAVGAAAFLGIAVTSLAYTTAMDGWDGSEWAYSQAFAKTVPQVPPKYIFTNWLWNSVQAGIDEEPAYHLEPGYRPCWSEIATHSPMDWEPSDPPGNYFVRTYHTWVVTFRYEMQPYNGAAARPVCHMTEALSAVQPG